MKSCKQMNKPITFFFVYIGILESAPHPSYSVGNFLALPLQYHCCTITIAVLLLQQYRCSVTNVALPLQRYQCSVTVVALPLQRYHCSVTVTALLLQRYRCSVTIACWKFLSFHSSVPLNFVQKLIPYIYRHKVL